MAVYMVQQSAAIPSVPVCWRTEERATRNNPVVNHCKEGDSFPHQVSKEWPLVINEGHVMEGEEIGKRGTCDRQTYYLPS